MIGHTSCLDMPLQYQEDLLHDDGMRRDEALRLLQLHRPDLCRFGVASLKLCGSVARDEARSDSDLDVLVEFERGAPRFSDYMDLKLFLEDLFGCEVDVLTPGGLKSRARDSILAQAIDVP